MANKLKWDYSLITIKEAQSLKGNYVYGIYDDCGDIIYVGKTANPSRRFYCYINTRYCHNVNLAELLDSRECRISLIKVEEADMDSLEIKLIARFRESVVNIHDGGTMKWRQSSKPWQAKHGVLCPSSYIMRDYGKTLGAENKEHIEHRKGVLKDKKEMSIVERCKYEISVAMRFYHVPRYKIGIDKWLGYSGESIFDVLNNEAHR